MHVSPPLQTPSPQTGPQGPQSAGQFMHVSPASQAPLLHFGPPPLELLELPDAPPPPLPLELLLEPLPAPPDPPPLEADAEPVGPDPTPTPLPPLPPVPEPPEPPSPSSSGSSLSTVPWAQLISPIEAMNPMSDHEKIDRFMDGLRQRWGSPPYLRRARLGYARNPRCGAP
jgi:hypothetical protein